MLERPPPGENSDWCFREVYTAKSNGEPRRTVDYRPLNKWVKRDAYATESPFHVVRRIPGQSWKTVTDAWNGYHSIPLHQNSRHLTTFISMEGKFRYTRTPQGANFAGDAYNRRHAAITADFPRKETVVDDTCQYDDINELEQHWWRTIDYLILCGENGIILTPENSSLPARMLTLLVSAYQSHPLSLCQSTWMPSETFPPLNRLQIYALGLGLSINLLITLSFES